MSAFLSEARKNLTAFIVALEPLTDDQRAELIGDVLDKYCQHCGRSQDGSRCQCENEE